MNADVSHEELLALLSKSPKDSAPVAIGRVSEYHLVRKKKSTELRKVITQVKYLDDSRAIAQKDIRTNSHQLHTCLERARKYRREGNIKMFGFWMYKAGQHGYEMEQLGNRYQLPTGEYLSILAEEKSNETRSSTETPTSRGHECVRRNISRRGRWSRNIPKVSSGTDETSY